MSTVKKVNDDGYYRGQQQDCTDTILDKGRRISNNVKTNGKNKSRNADEGKTVFFVIVGYGYTVKVQGENAPLAQDRIIHNKFI